MVQKQEFRISEMTPRQIYRELDRYVIGQQDAKRAAAVGAYNHIKRVNAVLRGEKTLLKKTNMLLAGPTGSGKTHIARTLAGILDLAFVVADATEYTEAGYYGKDVEVMVGELLFSTDLDVDRTETGIIFLDEIDKIARRSGAMRTGAGSRDIGGEGVQQSLLKLLEGRKIFVPLNVTQHWNKHDFVPIDTTNILFICAGTFTDVWQKQSGDIGFGGQKDEAASPGLTSRRLADFGLLPELLGRLPVVVELQRLREDALLDILTTPPDSLTREYTEVLGRDGVEVEFCEDGLRLMARHALGKELGARSLRAIMETVMHDLLFDGPELKGKHIRIDAAYVAPRLGATKAAEQ